MIDNLGKVLIFLSVENRVLVKITHVTGRLVHGPTLCTPKSYTTVAGKTFVGGAGAHGQSGV